MKPVRLRRLVMSMACSFSEPMMMGRSCVWPSMMSWAVLPVTYLLSMGISVPRLKSNVEPPAGGGVPNEVLAGAWSRGPPDDGRSMLSKRSPKGWTRRFRRSIYTIVIRLSNTQKRALVSSIIISSNYLLKNRQLTGRFNKGGRKHGGCRLDNGDYTPIGYIDVPE